MKFARPSILASLLFAACLAPAQKAVDIKRGSADFKAIIQAVTPYANAHSAHPVRVPGDTVRRVGDWTYVYSSLHFVNPKDQGDGKLMAILRKGRRWTIREIIVGSGDLDAILAGWAKKHNLPAALAKKPA